MKNIITASGTATEICEKLRILTAIFGKEATLSEIKKSVEFLRLSTITTRQLNEIIKNL